jgi:diacylglycerol kinase (ATP)
MMCHGSDTSIQPYGASALARTRVLVIANPAADGTTTALVDAVVQYCRTHLANCDVFWTTASGAATVTAEQADCDVVIGIGGDGTIREIAAGLAARPDGAPVLLALPAGSGNSFCLGLWGDCDRWQALEDAFDAGRTHVRHLDMMRVVGSGAVGLLGVSAGILADGLLIDSGQTGVDRYRAAAAAVLAHPPSFACLVRIDDEVIFEGQTSLVNVGGGRLRVAGTLHILPRSVLDDGLLDVCVVAGVSADELTALMPLITAGRHIGHPQVAYAQGRRVTVERTDGHALVVESDGDVLPQQSATLTVEVMAGAIGVLAPLTPVAG